MHAVAVAAVQEADRCRHRQYSAKGVKENARIEDNDNYCRSLANPCTCNRIFSEAEENYSRSVQRVNQPEAIDEVLSRLF